METSSENLDSLASGAGIGLAGRFVGRFLNVLENIIAARLLGPAAFGMYALGWTVFRLAELLSPLGFDIGTAQYGARYAVAGNRQTFRGMVSVSVIVSLIVSGIFGFTIYQFSPWLASEVFDQQGLALVLKLFAAAIPLAGLLAILSSVMRVAQPVKYSVLVQDLGQPLIAVAMVVLVSLAGLTTKRLVLVDLTSYLIAVLIAAYFVRSLYPDLFRSESRMALPKKEYFLFSWISSTAVFLSTLVFWIDRLFAGYYLSAADLGIYQSSLQVSAIFAVIMSALGRVLVPIFSTLHAQGNFTELEEVFRIGTKWGFFVSLPPVLIILLNPTTLLTALYGPAYSLGGNILIVLLLGQIANLITGAVGPLLLVGGHQRILLMLSGAVLVINTALCVILIPRLGLIGAALANSVSSGLMYSIALFFVLRKMRLWPYDRRYLKGAAAALLAALSGFFVRSLPNLSPVPSLATQLFVVTSIFVVVLYILGLTREDQAFAAMIMRRRQS